MPPPHRRLGEIARNQERDTTLHLKDRNSASICSIVSQHAHLVTSTPIHWTGPLARLTGCRRYRSLARIPAAQKLLRRVLAGQLRSSAPEQNLQFLSHHQCKIPSRSARGLQNRYRFDLSPPPSLDIEQCLSPTMRIKKRNILCDQSVVLLFVSQGFANTPFSQATREREARLWPVRRSLLKPSLMSPTPCGPLPNRRP